MSKGISRRNWIKLVGGSAVGLMITPIPWKILDETAKWSQNWSWTPVPRNGKIDFKYTTCTLCPMACGVRARCVDNQPVSLMGIPNHSISGGGLCALGLGGHLLPFHPSRLLQPFKVVRRNDDIKIVPISFDESISVVIQGISSSGQGSVAILDGQPKRTISYVYRKFLAELTNGVYITPPASGGILPEVIENVFGEKGNSFGFDIEDTKTILSFGAPVLDGWGTLGKFSEVVKNRSGKDKANVIQVESIHSRTSQLADQWVPLKPGTEAALALAIANVIIEEKLCDMQKLRSHSKDFDNNSDFSFVKLAKKFSPTGVSGQTGISSDKIVEIARRLATRKPSLVIFDGAIFSRDEQIIFTDLNVLLDAVDTKGGLVPRNEPPSPVEGKFVNETPLAGVPDHSIKVLIMDGAESGSVFPWQLLEQKLVTDNPMVVSLSPYFSGIARHADYLIPSPAYLESYNDSPSPASASVASYSISIPILTSPAGVVDPLNVMKRLAKEDFNNFPPHEILLKNRAVKIFKAKRGFVFDPATGKATKLSHLASSEQFMAILSNGGCWYDEGFRVQSSGFGAQYSLLGKDNHGFERLSATAGRGLKGSPLLLLPYATTVSQTHPLMTKLDRESDLRESGNTASINPDTAGKSNLTDGNKTIVKTEAGTMKVNVRFDKAVMPGIIQVSAGLDGDNILEICKIENDSTWRITKAEILPA